jgi:Protein of unknown function (DUF3995)
MTGLALLAGVISGIFLLLAAVHLYWAFGGQRGARDAVPEYDGKPLFRPRPGGTLVVAALLICAAAIVLSRARAGASLLSPLVRRWGAWGVAAVLILRAVGEFRFVGFFKRYRQTRFARLDTHLYSPLALALGIGVALIAWLSD